MPGLCVNVDTRNTNRMCLNVIAGFRPRVTFMADSVRLSSDGTAVTLGLRSNTKWKIR